MSADRDQTQELIDLIAKQDAAIDFPSFDHRDAFELGCAIVGMGVEQDLTIATSIVFGRQRVFHAALKGTTADNDDWAARKLRTVARFNSPTLLVALKLSVHGIELAQLPYLDPRRYALAGGGFPLRVNGSLIGGVAVSGLSARADHDVVVAGLEAILASKQ